MIQLVLKFSERVRSGLPRFEQFLEVYDLKIVKRTESKKTIKLEINARLFPEIRWVTSTSYDFFEEDLISITTFY
jgi:hypothetical protein